jgi:hypothetical protein
VIRQRASLVFMIGFSFFREIQLLDRVRVGFGFNSISGAAACQSESLGLS